MKLLAVTISYYPEPEGFSRNIESYVRGVDHLIIWENSSPDEKYGLRPELPEFRDRTSYMDAGKNVGIAHAVNRAIEYGLANGYTHLLTMDQDSSWDDFASFRQAAERLDDDLIGVIAPTVVLADGTRHLNPNAALTSGSLYPLDIFRKTGFFREDFEIDCVDTEFCYRLRSEGYKIRYLDNILRHELGHDIIVAGSIKTHNYSPYRLYHIARNEIRLVKSYGKSGIAMNHTPFSLRVFFIKQAFLILLGEKDRWSKIKAVIKGIRDGKRCRLWPDIFFKPLPVGDVRLLAVTFSYYPDREKFKDNIEKYLDQVEHLIIWENSAPEDREKYRPDIDSGSGKVCFMGTDRNEAIAYAANRAIEWGLENGYTHILMMDQDSEWMDFRSFRNAIERNTDTRVGVFGPQLAMFGEVYDQKKAGYVITSGAVYPLQLFREVGLLRERFAIDCIDTELSMRLLSAGYEMESVPAVLRHKMGYFTHRGRYTLYNYSSYRLFHIARNNVWLWKLYRYPDMKDFLYKQIVQTKNILLFEDKKISKLAAIWRGLSYGFLSSPGEINRLCQE